MSQQYRYPGVTPFSTDQRHLFFGRDEDIDELYKLLMRETIVILHGKSGLGKSSLINAGLLPRLEQQSDYHPMEIRLGARGDDHQQAPLHTTKQALPAGHPLLQKLLSDDDSLWTRAKALQLEKGKQPLLIFDQFEEIFSYPETEVTAFLQDVAELLHTALPLRYRRSLERSDNITEQEEDQLDEPLRVRLLFSLRSDRLHLLDRFKRYFPNILRHSFELQALTVAAARQAIVAPAALAGDFASPTFTYDDATLDKLLEYLQAEESPGRVEGILIQMLCEHYETKVVIPNGVRELRLQDIGEPDAVVQDYYEEKIAGLIQEEQLPARKLIEEGLVSEGEQGMRLSLHESTIESQHGVHKEMLSHLVDQRLLRSEPFLRGGYTYELSHDRLLPAVIMARSIRLEQEAREKQEKEAERLRREAEQERIAAEKARKQLRQVQWLLGLVIAALVVAGYLGYRSSEQTKELEAAYERITAEQKTSQDRLDAFEAEEKRRKDTEIDALLNKATTFQNLNQPALALRALREALQIDSTRQDVQQRIDNLQAAQNQ